MFKAKIKMDKQTKRKAFVFLLIGLLIVAASQVLSHYFELPDFAKGVFIGMGIGLLLRAAIFANPRKAK